jgi:tRNA1(Val) A37 N6-methylase TrmN6
MKFQEITVGSHTVALATRPSGFEPSTTSLLLALNLPRFDGKIVADLGCGTGIQGLIAALQGASQIHSCDLYEEDLTLTRANFERNNLAEKLTIYKVDILEGLAPLPKVDAAIFNLPSVAGYINELSSDTDRAAISSGDGASHSIATLKALSTNLTSNGKVYFTGSSIGNIKRLEQTLTELYQWNVIASVWMPLRYFEILQLPVIDNLVAQGCSYYKSDSGIFFSESRVYEASLK